MKYTLLFELSALFLVAIAPSRAHSGHEQIPVPADADWATRHMAGWSIHL